MFDSQDMTAFCLSELLHTIKIFGTLPHMRTLAIRYSNFSKDDIFDCYQYIDLPDQIENLDVSFSKTILNHFQPRKVDPPWYLPQVRRLSIKGGDENLVANYLEACPRLQVLEIDFKIKISRISLLTAGSSNLRDYIDKAKVRDLKLRNYARTKSAQERPIWACDLQKVQISEAQRGHLMFTL
jgi:hypothetical protein